jgi:hypothetical protein
MMTRLLRSLRVAAVLATSLLLPVSALAVETTGSLKGVVQDTSGTALPGITVTASSDSQIGGPKTAVTDDQGRFRFPALAVGTYSIKAEHEGFRTAEQKTYVGIGSELSLEFNMQLPTAEETFVITDVRPVVDVENTQSGATYDDEFLSKIPSGRTYQGITQFVAGVTGGGNPNVHGETLYSNSYLLDGVNITDPVTHTFSTNFNFDAIEAIEIITGGYDAEYGQATGAIVNIVTKSGGNELSVDSSIYYSDYNTASGGKKTNGEFRDANANVNVGGPIIKDKVWFFASYEFNQVQTQPSEKVNQNTGITVSKKPHTYQGNYLLGKITWQMNPSHKLTAQVQSDPTTISNTGANASLPAATRFPDAYALREQGGANYSVSHDWVINGATLLRTQIGYVDSILNELPGSGDYNTAPHVNSNGDRTVNYTDYYWDRRQRLVASSKVTRFVDDMMGSHKVRAGFDFNQDTYPVVNGFNGDAYYYDAGYQTDVDGNIIFDNDGNPVGNPDTKYEFDGSTKTVTKGFLLGAFIQDDWKPIDNLTLKVGFRFDHSEYENDVGRQVINFNTIAPRLFLAWDPTKDQKTVLTTGYAQSYDNGSLLVPDFVKSRATTGRIYEWDGSQYSYAGDYGNAEGYQLKKLRAPVKNEVQFGVQRELATNLAMGGRLILSRTQYYFEDDESNLVWNADGSDAIGFKDGVDHYIFRLKTPANSYRDYRGIEITLTKAFSDGWLVDGSYTLADARGTNDAPISVFADNPVQNKYLDDGELPYNVANALKFQTTKELPYGFTIGAAYFFETGNPYDRLYENTYYGSYQDYRDKPGQFHYDPFQRVDMRGQWSKKFGRNTLSVTADVFNVLDSRTVTLRQTEYNPEVSDEDDAQTFGRVLDRQNPLQARLGLRYNF